MFFLTIIHMHAHAHTHTHTHAHAHTHTHMYVDCMMEWLLSLGINQDLAMVYHSNFSSELVDQTTLQLMSASDLKEVGVMALGHRVLIHRTAVTGEDSWANGSKPTKS